MTKKEAKKPAPPRVERRIQFFRALAVDPKGEVAAQGFDFGAASSRITRKSVAARYMKLDKDRTALVHPTRNGKTIQIVLATIRERFQSSVEEHGQVGPLFLDGDRKQAEVSRAVVFEDGIVGIEKNHFGPKAGTTERYFNAKGRGAKANLSLELAPLHDPELSARVARMTTLKKFRIEAYPQIGKHLKKKEPAEELLRRMSLLAEQEDTHSGDDPDRVVVFELRERARGLGHALDPKMKTWLRTLVTRVKVRERVHRISLSGYLDGEQKQTTLDLLQEYIIESASLVTYSEATRSVADDEMFKAIARLYAKRKAVIQKAVYLRAAIAEKVSE